MAEKLTLVVDLDTGEVTRGLDQLDKKTTKAGKSIGKNFSAAMLAGGTVVAGIGGYAIKSAADAETAFAKLRTIAGKDFDAIKQQIMALPPELGAVTETAEAAYQAISAGRKPGEAIRFVADAARAAKGGFTDVTTAVDAATTVLNSYGAKAGSTQQIFDKFLLTQNLGKTTFAELAPRIGEVAKTADVAGESFDSLLGSIATLTASGIRTPQAITGIRAAISNLSKPSKEAADELDRIGVTLTKEDGLIGSLAKIRASSDDVGGSITKIFGSIEGRTAIEVLNGEFEKTTSNINAIKGAAGDADQAAQIMFGTTASQVEALKVGVNQVAVEFGETLLPAVKDSLKFIKEEFWLIEGTVRSVVDFIQKARDGIAYIGGGLGAASVAAGEALSGNIGGAAAAVGVDVAPGVAQALQSGFGAAANAIPGGAALKALASFAGFRASGGPVSPGNSYIVGEEGPELFTPALDGNILPNGMGLGGFGGDAYAAGAGGRIDEIRSRIAKLFKGATTEGIVEGADDATGMAKQPNTLAGTLYGSAKESLMRSIADGAKSGDVGDAMEGFAKGLGSQVFNQVKSALVSALGKKLLGGIFGGGFGGFFADGGRPPVGVPSIVGERGPEVFVPDRAGTIVPNHAMGGATVSLTFAPGSVVIGDGSGRNVGEDFVRQVMDVAGRLAQLGQIPTASRRLVTAGAV